MGTWGDSRNIGVRRHLDDVKKTLTHVFRMSILMHIWMRRSDESLHGVASITIQIIVDNQHGSVRKHNELKCEMDLEVDWWVIHGLRGDMVALLDARYSKALMNGYEQLHRTQSRSKDQVSEVPMMHVPYIT